jgi:hypothetical protein
MKVFIPLAALAFFLSASLATAQPGFVAPNPCPSCPGGVCPIPAPSTAPLTAGALRTTSGRVIVPDHVEAGVTIYRYADAGVCLGGGCAGPSTCGAGGVCSSCSTCTSGGTSSCPSCGNGQPARRGFFFRRR